MAGLMARVDELDFAELTRVDLGQGQTYPSLEEALIAFPEARFNIDLKSDAVVGPAVEAIIRAQAVQRVLVTSFKNGRRLRAVRALPGVATSASAVPFAAALIAAKLGLAPLTRYLLRDVQAVQVPERLRGVQVITPRIVRRLRHAGVEVKTLIITLDNINSVTLGIAADTIKLWYRGASFSSSESISIKSQCLNVF